MVEKVWREEDEGTGEERWEERWESPIAPASWSSTSTYETAYSDSNGTKEKSVCTGDNEKSKREVESSRRRDRGGDRGDRIIKQA